MTSLPHPLTGRPHDSPVRPGSGWPGDPATPRTPVARDDAAVVARAATARDLDALDARITVCRACPRLVAWREHVAATKRASYADQPYWGRPLSGWGDPHPQVYVVGLAPAAQGGNRTGRIFTGDRSGDWLYAALHRAGYADRPTSVHAGDGLHLTGVRIGSPVRCAPPDNAPTTDEKRRCAPWFDRELALVAPGLRALLALGGIAWASTIAAARRAGWHVPRPAPTFGHGAVAVLTTPQGRAIRLVGSYHVSQQNTFTGRLTETMLDEAVALCGPDQGLDG